MMHKASTAMERLAFIFALHHDRKTLKRVITRYGKYCTQAVREDIIQQILRSEDFQEAFDYLSYMYTNFKPFADQFAEEGFPGMVVTDDGEIHPIQITLLNAELRQKMFPGLTEAQAELQIKEDRYWALGNEYELQLGMGHGVMRALNLPRLYFKVMLFESKGFSGTVADLGVENIVEGYNPETNVRSVAGGRT